MAETVYSGKPVKRERREIRLVDLKPGSSGDPIVCTIRVVRLQSSPKYDTLSYYWGDRKGQAITLDGVVFRVQANLETALRELRRIDHSRTLWVDALCINQKDETEKSWHVNMMGEIYANCRKGLLFLGTDSEKTDSWCNCESRANEKCQKAQAEGRRWHHRRPRMSDGRDFLKQLADLDTKRAHLNNIPSVANLLQQSDNRNDEFMEPIQSVGALMRRSWWSRMWTVQEAILPPETTIVCGQIRMNWEILVKAAKAWEFHTTSGCCNAVHKAMNYVLRYPTRGNPTSGIMNGFCQEVKSIEDIRQLRRIGVEPKFLNVYRHFGHRQAGISLDKVYALLGLFGENSRPCSAAYDKTMRKLNRELSKHFLLTSAKSPFEVLYGSSISPEDISRPSWQFDFSSRWRKAAQMLEDHRNLLRADYSASGRKLAQVKELESPNSGSISVLGAKVDHVEKASDVFTKSDFGNVRSFCKKCLEDIGYEKRQAFAYPSDRKGKETFLTSLLNKPSGRTVGKAFQRAILGNRCLSQAAPSGLRDVDVQDLVSLEKWMSSSDYPLKDTLMSQVRSTVRNRKFFSTKGGLVGFGPSSMREGDEVWLIYGDRVPFILRPLKIKDDQRQDLEHGIVGDSYVQGIMEGEAVQKIPSTQATLR